MRNYQNATFRRWFCPRSLLSIGVLHTHGRAPSTPPSNPLKRFLAKKFVRSALEVQRLADRSHDWKSPDHRPPVCVVKFVRNWSEAAAATDHDSKDHSAAESLEVRESVCVLLWFVCFVDIFFYFRFLLDGGCCLLWSVWRFFSVFLFFFSSVFVASCLLSNRLLPCRAVKQSRTVLTWLQR